VNIIYNLKVIEDAAESHGVKPVGDIACFSLFANKIISAGEGGVCLTNDRYLAEQMKYLRAMSFDKNHTFLHKEIGYNFRMTNMQAAVAKAQVEQIEEILNKRKKIEERYNKGLKDVKGITLMPNRDVLWYYDLLAEDRDALRKYLEKHEIDTRVFFKPMSQQPMYFNSEWKKLKAAKFAEKGLYLPTYTDLSEEDQDYIISKIKDFYENEWGGND